MKSNNTLLVAIICVFLLAISLFVLQKRTKETLQSFNSVQEYSETLERYLNDSFYSQSCLAEDQIAEMLFEHADTLSFLVYVPITACRACFSTLLFYLDERNDKMPNFLVVIENNDPQIVSECMVNGIKYGIISSNFHTDNILIMRKKEGYLPMKMKYHSGDDRILDLFFRD